MEQDIDKYFTVDKNLDVYEKYVLFYKVLEKCNDNYIEKMDSFSTLDVLFSKYYWFLKLKKENELLNGADAGYDQMADKLLINIYEYSGIGFDPDIFAEYIKIVENMASKG